MPIINGILVILLIVFSFIIPYANSGQSDLPQKETTLSIFYTNDVAGYLESCD